MSRSWIDRKQLEADLGLLFRLFDSQKTGFVNALELRACLKALGMKIGVAEVRKLLNSMGVQDMEAITFDVFYAVIESNLPRPDDPAVVISTFQNLGGSEVKGITFDDLKQAFAKLGEPCTDADIQIMINYADTNGDGVVELEDFYRIIRDYFD